MQSLFLCVILFLFKLLSFFFVLYTTGNVTGSKANLAISQSLILIICLQYTIKQFSESVSLMTPPWKGFFNTRIFLRRNLLPRTIHRHYHLKDNWFWRVSTWNVIWMIHQFWRYKINQLFLQILFVFYYIIGFLNLNVFIEPGWKVEVVGQTTGAGKFSLIFAFFACSVKI